MNINNTSSQVKCNFSIIKKEIDIEYSLLEEFYLELKDKLVDIIETYPIDETTKYFLIKMFRLEDSPDSKHFDLVSFVERIKDFSEVRSIKFIVIIETIYKP